MPHGFECVWNKLVAKKPLLKDEAASVTISVPQFKKLLNSVYEHGKADEAARDRTQRLMETFFGKTGFDFDLTKGTGK